jgi:anaerobic ribonucleoside-triphosphate reductase activating protein
MDAISPWLGQSEGVTVSGGEPFDQEDALREFLVRIREITTGNILIYSGYSWERLLPRLTRFEGLIDALITDPFLADAPQTLALRCMF